MGKPVRVCATAVLGRAGSTSQEWIGDGRLDVMLHPVLLLVEGRVLYVRTVAQGPETGETDADRITPRAVLLLVVEGQGFVEFAAQCDVLGSRKWATMVPAGPMGTRSGWGEMQSSSSSTRPLAQVTRARRLAPPAVNPTRRRGCGAGGDCLPRAGLDGGGRRCRSLECGPLRRDSRCCRYRRRPYVDGRLEVRVGRQSTHLQSPARIGPEPGHEAVGVAGVQERAVLVGGEMFGVGAARVV